MMSYFMVCLAAFEHRSLKILCGYNNSHYNRRHYHLLQEIKISSPVNILQIRYVFMRNARSD